MNKKSIEKHLQAKSEETPVNFKADANELKKLKAQLKKNNISIKDFFSACIKSYLENEQ